MHVRVVKAGDDRPAGAVDHAGCRPSPPQDLIVITDRANLPILDRDGLDKEWNTIRRNLGIVQYRVGLHASSFLGVGLGRK
jgi:hypothetical protein